MHTNRPEIYIIFQSYLIYPLGSFSSFEFMDCLREFFIFLRQSDIFTRIFLDWNGFFISLFNNKYIRHCNWYNIIFCSKKAIFNLTIENINFFVPIFILYWNYLFKKVDISPTILFISGCINEKIQTILTPVQTIWYKINIIKCRIILFVNMKSMAMNDITNHNWCSE